MAASNIEEEEDELLRPYKPPEPPKPADDMVSVLEAVTEIREHPPGELTLDDVASIVARAVQRNGYKLKQREPPASDVSLPPPAAKKPKQPVPKKTKSDT